MDSVYRDLTRLALIQQCSFGQESFSLPTRFKDFTGYYLTRFLTNITHVFSDFSSSEIEQINNRHHNKLSILLKHPGFTLEKQIIPIPKGMIKSYKETLDDLISVSIKLYPKNLKDDVTGLLNDFTKPVSPVNKDNLYTESDFEQAKTSIGRLYSTSAISHAFAKNALRSIQDINDVNQNLIYLTKTYYPEVIALYGLLKKVDNHYAKTDLSIEQKEVVSQQLMTLAYRLSIFAIVMKHVQEMEHAFVKSLTLLINDK